MKKVINVKEIMIVMISVILITFSTSVFATDLVIGGGNDNTTTTIPANEYDNAQTVPDDTNTTSNTSTNTTNNTANTSSNKTNNKTNNITNNVKKYNTSNKTDLPQTGIEDYNIGILLIIGVASAIFAYKKVNYYKNI